MEDRWFGNEFQILGATDENDLEVAMVVSRGGTHIYWERRRRAECSRRHISWDERWNRKIGWLLRLEHSESNRGNFETNSVANRKPMQIRENRRNFAEPRFLCDNSSKSILNTLKARSDLKQVCQPGELSCRNQVGSQLYTAAMVFEASIG